MYWPNLARAAKKLACLARSQRTVALAAYLAYEWTIVAFDRYIKWRYERGAGAVLDQKQYRDLMPYTRLIFTQKGMRSSLASSGGSTSTSRLLNTSRQTASRAMWTSLYRLAGLGIGY